MELRFLSADWAVLLAAVALDLALGDPACRWHPVRVIGRTISLTERWLRATGADGHAGGCALVVLIGGLWAGAAWVVQLGLQELHAVSGWLYQFAGTYTFLALGDLLKHCDDVDGAGGDARAARRAVARLVGRDTGRLDAGSCRRAAIESLAENLVDGFIAPVFWYVVGGLPGLVLFKAVSTMDSMVGYRNDRYLRFGWAAARSDDLLVYVPARLSWLLVAAAAVPLPGGSGRKACRIGWRQHGKVPGPNPGWSEAAMAGAIQRRLAGPIWLDGTLVTETWLGDPLDPPASAPEDYRLSRRIALATAAMAVGVAVLGLSVSRH